MLSLIAQCNIQVYGNATLQWQKPLDSWLADNGCSRQTCFLTATYEEPDTGRMLAPDGYLFPSNFTAVTNLAKANVTVVTIEIAPAKPHYLLIIIFDPPGG